MNRRTSLAILTGKNVSDLSVAAKPAAAVTSGLSPYSGPFEYEQAAHLLRRTIFGPTYKQIREAVDKGLDGTMEQLFTAQPMPAPPVNFEFAEDPHVPIGETWVNAPYTPGVPQIPNYRNQSLRAWTFEVIHSEGVSVREKLVLFWHNHFVTGDINDPKFVYKYITLFRENAWGSFKELVKKITIDPAMLRYLNGNQNTAAAPNENYSRELLELFAIGKGPVAGPGDYTNYTEEDVVSMARVLTGWRDIGFNTLNPSISVDAVYVSNRHDKQPKQLSHRFGNVVINNMESDEYAHLIDIIFSREECARFICRKLYRWFVYYVINDQVEAEVIKPMAELMVANDYDIRKPLEALLRSEHFFDMLNVGPMIKNPMDFVFSVLKTLEVEFPTTLRQKYRVWWQVFRQTGNPMQMVYYNPPNVAGWKAYYQEPVFYRTWISSATLPVRMEFTSRMINQGLSAAGATVKVDVLKFAASLDDPFDPNILIDDFSKIILPQPITQSQKYNLKEVLIPGLPDFEWTIEYGDYVNNPSDPNAKAAVETKLRNLLTAMLSMPEFYLS